MLNYLAYVSFDDKVLSEKYKNVSAKNRVQDKVLHKLKLRVNHTYKKEEKTKANFEPFIKEMIYTTFT